MKQLQLETPRLQLRGYRESDWERIHSYAAIPEFSQYENWGPNTVDDTKKFVADQIESIACEPRFKFEFAVCLAADGLLVGGIGIRRESQESMVANMGWAIHPDFQKLGYATEAARRLIEFGLADLGLAVIYATCDTRNSPSYRVMEKLGMRRVGFLPAERIVKGYKRDTYRYEITSLAMLAAQ